MNRVVALVAILAVAACASPAPPASPSGATPAPPTSGITPTPTPKRPSLSPTSPAASPTAPATPNTPSPGAPGPSAGEPTASAPPGPGSLLLVSTYENTTWETLDPLTGVRQPFTVPADTRWVATGPSTMAMTLGAEDSRAVVVVDRFAAGQPTESWRVSLPADEHWLGAHAACLWGDQVIAANDGLELFLVRPGQQPEVIPTQRSNLGGCTWLDQSHVLWDQEEGNPLRVWSVGDPTAATLTIRGRDPSSGGSRLAWSNDLALHVADYSIAGGQVVVQAPMLSLPTSMGHLSPDGRWLAVRSDSAPGVVIIYELGPTAAVERSRIALGDNEYVSWLPPSQ